MKGALEILAGGIGKLFALILATFPENAACYCTNGEKSIKAKSKEFPIIATAGLL